MQVVVLRSDPDRTPGKIIQKVGRKRVRVLFRGRTRPTEHLLKHLEPFDLFTAQI